jgi:hypothetical protein
MYAPSSSNTPFDREDPKSYDDGPDDDEVDLLDPSTRRDLFDSPADSWRDLEIREALDELDPEPVERAQMT